MALSRRLGARANQALCLAGDVASTGTGEDAEGYYREALALAGELGMRPLVAHCHLGLGKLYRRAGKREPAREHLTTATTMFREMDMRLWLPHTQLSEEFLREQDRSREYRALPPTSFEEHDGITSWFRGFDDLSSVAPPVQSPSVNK